MKEAFFKSEDVGNSLAMNWLNEWDFTEFYSLLILFRRQPFS
jgi:hypothetical protein